MTDRQLSKLDAARELALRDGDTQAAAEYERRINELLEEDRVKVMGRMNRSQVFRLRPMPEPILN